MPDYEKLVTNLTRRGYTVQRFPTARQAAAAEEALAAVDRALEALEMGQTQDLAALDLEIAMERLGEIDGRSVREDIVSEIFSRFCVGK